MRRETLAVSNRSSSQADRATAGGRSKRHPHRLLLPLMVTATLVLACPVLGQEPISFGLRPAQQGIGHFTYSLEPGESITDEIVASNACDVAVTLRIYALDAHSSSNGGVIFPGGVGTVNTSAGAWLSLSLSQVTIEPGMDITLPFTFTVPIDARVGEHVAGIVAENAEPIAGSPNPNIPVVQRIALPVWETVPGPTVTGLQIGSVECAAWGANSGFHVEMTNTGNVSLNAVLGTLQITNQTHLPICSLPVEVNGKLLAGDTIVYPVNVNQTLPPDRYRVAVDVTYGDDGFQDSASWNSFFRFPGWYPENHYLHVPLYIRNFPLR